MENNKEQIAPVEQCESIKLIHNTKGYFWEIKVLDLDTDRLAKIDQEMKIKFKGDSQ